MTTTPSPEKHGKLIEEFDPETRFRSKGEAYMTGVEHGQQLSKSPQSQDWNKDLSELLLAARNKTAAEEPIALLISASITLISDLLMEERGKRDAEWVEALDKSKERGAKWVSKLLASLTHNI